MTTTTKTRATKAKRAPGLEDPAIVAEKKLQEAAAALSALPADTYADEQKPEYKAAEKREREADIAFSAAPVTSLAGALIKLRALGKDIIEDSGPDAWALGHVKTVTTFLEGTPPPASKPDPVVVLFAKWGTIEDEIIAFGKAHPDSDDPDIEEQREELIVRQSAVEDQIIETAATSVGGIAVKLRLLAYMKFAMAGLPELYATPAKDTDFEGFIEGWREEKGLFIDETLLIDSLRDAERLAGVS